LLIIYIIWLLFQAVFSEVVHQIHFILIKGQAWASASSITLLGYQGHYVDGDAICLGRIFINGNPSVCVGTGCSGLEMFIVYAAFIIVMNGGKWVKMSWYLPMGMLIMMILNVFRIVSLAFIHKFAPQYLYFNHKYTFVLMLYGAVFGLWYIWITRIAVANNTKHEE